MEGSGSVLKGDKRRRFFFNFNSPNLGESVYAQFERLLRLAKAGYSRKDEIELSRDDLTSYCKKCGGHAVLEVKNRQFTRKEDNGDVISVGYPSFVYGCTNPNCMADSQTEKFENISRRTLIGLHKEKYGVEPDLTRDRRTWEIPTEGEYASSTVKFDRNTAILFKGYCEESGITPLECLERMVAKVCSDYDNILKKREKAAKKAAKEREKALKESNNNPV